MLDAFETKGGISLMDGTGVAEEDILRSLIDFNQYAAKNPDSDLVTFFSKKRINPKVMKAFALIGMKYVVDEYYRLAKEQDNAENQEDNT